MWLVSTAETYLSNIINIRFKSHLSILCYVIESADWSTKWDGKYITESLNNQKLLKARTTLTHKGIRNQIIHFGSRNLFLPNAWSEIDSSNKIVFTWFHGTEEDKAPGNLAMIKALPEASQKAEIIHTSCSISEANLIKWGVPPDKIVVVPLGIDLGIFNPVSEGQKRRIREELGLPQDKTIIGSFQKDGVGWGEGLEPKWVKGPDIFVKVIAELINHYDILVLLTGPARGNVKRELDKIGVPYRHSLLKDYGEIPKYYNALDLYLVTSRAEGGPKAVMESMATGVPILSTRVGMAVDVIKNGHNGLLAEIDDAGALVEKTVRIMEDKGLTGQMVRNALDTVKKYSWENIAREYYEKIYRRVLSG